mmetsp:Transcript_36988/g.93433  ORF Transcript_36988/g.93433 Transcript_36988/m.93433 type:complete len:228 (+) Transcript_36988:108-791(+)
MERCCGRAAGSPPRWTDAPHGGGGGGGGARGAGAPGRHDRHRRGGRRADRRRGDQRWGGRLHPGGAGCGGGAAAGAGSPDRQGLPQVSGPDALLAALMEAQRAHPGCPTNMRYSRSHLPACLLPHHPHRALDTDGTRWAKLIAQRRLLTKRMLPPVTPPPPPGSPQPKVGLASLARVACCAWRHQRCCWVSPWSRQRGGRCVCACVFRGPGRRRPPPQAPQVQSAVH